MSENTRFEIVGEMVRAIESWTNDGDEEFDSEMEDIDEDFVGAAIVGGEQDLEPLELQRGPFEVQQSDWSNLYPSIWSTWGSREPDRLVSQLLTPEEEKEMEYKEAKRRRDTQACLQMYQRIFHNTR